MKDESRAKWPEGIGHDEFINNDGYITWVVTGEVISAKARGILGEISEYDEDIVNVRFKQICALPAMVALLKELPALLPLRGSAKETAGIVEIAKRVRAILKQIGEVE